MRQTFIYLTSTNSRSNRSNLRISRHKPALKSRKREASLAHLTLPSSSQPLIATFTSSYSVRPRALWVEGATVSRTKISGLSVEALRGSSITSQRWRRKTALRSQRSRYPASWRDRSSLKCEKSVTWRNLRKRRRQRSGSLVASLPIRTASMYEKPPQRNQSDTRRL